MSCPWHTKRLEFWHTLLYLLRQEVPLYGKEAAFEHKRVYLLTKIRTRVNYGWHMYACNPPFIITCISYSDV